MLNRDRHVCGTLHIAGNAVLDLPLRNVALDMGPAADGWERGNVHFPDRPVEGVERAYTVGAGDTFNAGLLDGLCRGLTLETAVRNGVQLATEAVRQGRGVLGALGSNGG